MKFSTTTLVVSLASIGTASAFAPAGRPALTRLASTAEAVEAAPAAADEAKAPAAATAVVDGAVVTKAPAIIESGMNVAMPIMEESSSSSSSSSTGNRNRIQPYVLFYWIELDWFDMCFLRLYRCDNSINLIPCGWMDFELVFSLRTDFLLHYNFFYWIRNIALLYTIKHKPRTIHYTLS